MANIYDPGKLSISQNKFESFLQQYLRGSLQTSLDLVAMLKNRWLQQVDESHVIQPRKVALYATNSKFKGLYTDALGKPGAYAIFAKHPDHCPTNWICFYVGISENDVRQRMVQHHCRDIRENYRGEFDWLSQCTDVLNC